MLGLVADAQPCPHLLHSSLTKWIAIITICSNVVATEEENVTNPFEDENGVYHVLINEEGQHSLWPSFIAGPRGLDHNSWIGQSCRLP